MRFFSTISILHGITKLSGAHFSSGTLFEKAAQNVNDGQYENAKEHFQEAIKINSEFYAAHNRLGFLHQHHLNEPLLAQKHFEKTIEINLQEAHFNLGFLYEVHLNEPLLAKKHYEKVIQIKPNHVRTHLRLARLMIVDLNFKEAWFHFSKWFELTIASFHHILLFVVVCLGIWVIYPFLTKRMIMKALQREQQYVRNLLTMHSTKTHLSFEQDCVICLETKRGIRSRLKCGHIFHENCIVVWLKETEKCPLCFQPIRTGVDCSKRN